MCVCVGVLGGTLNPELTITGNGYCVDYRVNKKTKVVEFAKNKKVFHVR